MVILSLTFSRFQLD